MNTEDLNKDVRTQINPEDEVKAAPKSGYTQVKDLMDTVHGYCMDYTKASFNFIVLRVLSSLLFLSHK